MTDVSLHAPGLRATKLSVTRQMAASLSALKALPPEEQIRLHHLGAGYPHPDVSEPGFYMEKQARYFRQICERNGVNDAATARAKLEYEIYNYTDTLGPRGPRVAWTKVYGRDFGLDMDPERAIPTCGGTGGLNLVCSLFERAGEKIAYITDAPTYAGFLSRALLNKNATIFSVEMDAEGPKPDLFRAQVRAAKDAGYFVPFYYTVPDGHNPAGITLTQRRREEILAVAREEGILIVEDAAYIYISYQKPEERPKPFFVMDPKQTIHVFTGSKIGLPGPRVGFLYSEATLAVDGGAKNISITELLLAEAAADMLFHNPEALRGFEAYLADEDGHFDKSSLWDVATRKLAVYADNRHILLDGLNTYLGDWPEKFSWTIPGGGFFSVFRFHAGVDTDAAFIDRLMRTYGLIVIPMFGFYPEDARLRDPRAGLDSIRISFCFNESTGEGRRTDMIDAVKTFCHAVRVESGLPGIL